MSAKAFHLDRPTARFFAAIAILATLTGCQAIVSSAPQAHVRIINATPDSPRLDLYDPGWPVVGTSDGLPPAKVVSPL